jgi:hypothetical protein
MNSINTSLLKSSKQVKEIINKLSKYKKISINSISDNDIEILLKRGYKVVLIEKEITEYVGYLEYNTKIQYYEISSSFMI